MLAIVDLRTARTEANIDMVRSRGGRTRLPKFKFSANFPIGLHVILELQIKKFKTCLNRMRKIILTENPLGFDREPLLK